MKYLVLAFAVFLLLAALANSEKQEEKKNANQEEKIEVKKIIENKEKETKEEKTEEIKEDGKGEGKEKKKEEPEEEKVTEKETKKNTKKKPKKKQKRNQKRRKAKEKKDKKKKKSKKPKTKATKTKFGTTRYETENGYWVDIDERRINELKKQREKRWKEDNPEDFDYYQRIKNRPKDYKLTEEDKIEIRKRMEKKMGSQHLQPPKPQKQETVIKIPSQESLEDNIYLYNEEVENDNDKYRNVHMEL